jgi:ABC-type phosphate/phosphonate transport system substrate-binding protein
MNNRNILLCIALAALTAPAAAADKSAGLAVANYTPPARTVPATGGILAGDDVLVLSAPPRDTPEDGARRFGPVAAHLSKTLGRKVVYRHPGTWGAYQAEMVKGSYDLVFDAPHFNGWRVEKLGHNVLIKVPGEYTYTIFVRSDSTRIRDVNQLAGHKICAHAPPHLGTLVMWRKFDNPSRQPTIVVTDGYDKVYASLLAGKCEAAVLSEKHLRKWDKDGAQTRVVYRAPTLPQQALSAGPRLSAGEQAKIAEALLSPAAQEPLRALREAYGLGGDFVAARNEEYAGLSQYLNDQWGYY